MAEAIKKYGIDADKPTRVRLTRPSTETGQIEVKVPDIGDFKDVEVIELLVKPGDTVAAEQSLITRRVGQGVDGDSRRPAAGVVKELKVKVGDKVRRAR